MKRILITGANSYVGTNVEAWLNKKPELFLIDTIDLRNFNWKNYDFSVYDVVFHVAGIAHVSTKKNMKDLYFKVNRDLTIDVAKHAKQAGVRQFMFMSSMIVYNSKESVITAKTTTKPDNFYGLSKLQAEQGISTLSSENFIVTILRPPMIYGPKSKGNFPKLVSLANKVPIFPNYKNRRSMLYIDNLSNTIEGLISNPETGIFFPQNNEYSCTSGIIKDLSALRGRKILFFKILNPIIVILKRINKTFNKMFGDYYYEFELSKSTENYTIIDLYTSLVVIKESL